MLAAINAVRPARFELDICRIAAESPPKPVVEPARLDNNRIRARGLGRLVQILSTAGT
ncbi:hypothetical protein NXC24_PB00119 (plasmid) [Rhizobium sp. NXC24]|nr:hypothetical protein NXC24_PB00119 [Rhizobium sp. NXC24]